MNRVLVGLGTIAAIFGTATDARIACWVWQKELS
jgi:hypothetical protein